MGNLLTNVFGKDEPNREGFYVNEPGKQPNNRENNGVMPGGEKEAKDYIDLNTKQNCCTIEGKQVTKWSCPTNKVKLMTADSGITFLCHRDLQLE